MKNKKEVQTMNFHKFICNNSECAADILRFLLDQRISFNAKYLADNGSEISYELPVEKDESIIKYIENNFLCKKYYPLQ